MAKGQKKRSASNGGNTADKSHKRSSAEGDNDKNEDAGTNGAPGDGERMTATNVHDMSSTKGDGATTPHDCDAETNLQKDPCCGNRPPPHEKNDQESMDKVTKGQKKHSASYGGNLGAVPTTSMCRRYGQSHMWLDCTSFLPYPKYDVNRLVNTVQ